jgi:hypothetical protein
MLNIPYFPRIGAALLAVTALFGAEDASVSDQRIKALFLLRVAEYVEWSSSSPAADKSKPFIIGILGKANFERVLEAELPNVPSLKGKPVKLLFAVSVSRLDTCNVVFISATEQDRLEDLLAYLKGKPILTLGDTPEYAKKGVMFNMQVREGKFSFELNLKTLRAAGLRVESRVQARALIVDR